MTRTWTIRDIDGSNERQVTLAQFRAEVDAAKAKAEKIHECQKALIAKCRGIQQISQ